VDPTPSGLVHFLKRAAVADLLRWQMILHWPDLVERVFNRYILSAPEPRVGLDCAWSASTGIWPDTPLPERLIQDLKDRLSTASPGQ
jgi:hypothetical protein